MKKYACRYEELIAKGKLGVTVDSRPIVLILSRDNEVYALRDVCPHKGPRLSDGMIDTGCSGDTVGEYCYDADTEVIRCPWHSWEFDIKTGNSIVSPDQFRVKTYPTLIEEGLVFVDM